MSEHHPDRTDLEQYARSEMAAAEGRWVEDHLRAGCTVCQRIVDDLLPALDELCFSTLCDGLMTPRILQSAGISQNPTTPPTPPTPPTPLTPPTAELPEDPPYAENPEEAAWSKVFAKIEARHALISEERANAPRLVSELMRHSQPERIALLHSGVRFKTWALCELLIEESFRVGFSDLSAALELAQIALQAAEQLDAQYYGASVVQDLRARAWAYLGNARRINYDLTGAEQALNIAERLVEQGSADPLEEARILDLRASLLSDQGWLEEAADLLDSVIDIYEDVRDLHRKGRALISKGVSLGNAGFPEEAIELIPEGLSLLDREVEPRLVLMARHNLIVFLNDSGRCVEALRQLERLRSCYRAFPEPYIEIRLFWLEGRIAAGLRHFEEAERALKEVRRRLLDSSLAYEAALATLDLANIYLEQGRRDEVRRLAEEMLPIFLSQDVHRHAIAALVVFQQAVEGDHVTPARIQEIASYLLRARKNPRLCFRAAA
jgi:tetratricopeptide (TPR) repeat protein